MNQEDHLSRISTMWTRVFAAHGADKEAVKAAQHAVMERYSGTVYRYLLKVLRDTDTADEVFQQFALNFMRGDFRHVNPHKGRFRDYLKISLLRLVSAHQKKLARHRPTVTLSAADAAAAEPLSEEELATEYLASCRDELLSRAWKALKDVEDKTGRPLHATLDYRVRHPESTSVEMATELTSQLEPEKPYTDAGIRKTLQRSRETFSDLLLDEIVQSLGTHDRDLVEQEMIELRLQSYCGFAFGRKFK